MRKFLLQARIMMTGLISLLLSGIMVLILLGTSSHLAKSHEPPSHAPYTGTSNIDDDRSFQTFVFDSDALEAWFTHNGGGEPKPHPHNGYEHDVKTSPRMLLIRWSGWASNLPQKYLECDFEDWLDNESDFSVGSDNGFAMVAEWLYFGMVNTWYDPDDLYSPSATLSVDINAQITYRTWDQDPARVAGIPVWVFCQTQQWCGGEAGACNFWHAEDGLTVYGTNPLAPITHTWTE